ncbi:MAG TPA: hypothetical protein VMH39_10005 [Gemmatimonadaceae bacterium]|nr:hypothetical protein [Gemmatimonadaceae bacterium]
MTSTRAAPRIGRAERPAWVVAEYERIGREREQASREADRMYLRELVRACAQMLGWTAIGLVIAAFAFHAGDHATGMIFLYSGMIVNWGGVLWTIVSAYRRGEARGDW